MDPDRNIIGITLSIGILTAASAATLIELTEAPALAVAAYRMIFAAGLLFPFVILTSGEEILNLDRDRFVFTILAGLFLAIHFATWIKSLDYLPVPASVLLVNSHPIFVALFSFLGLSEKTNKKELMGIGASLIGVGIIVFPKLNQIGSLMGSLLALAGSITFALYLVSGRNLRKNFSLIPYIFLVYSAAAFILTGSCFTFEVSLSGFERKTYLLMFSIGLVPTVIGHTAFNWSVKHVKATLVSVASLGIPVLASFIAWVVLREPFTVFTIGGGSLIVVGVYLSSRK